MPDKIKPAPNDKDVLKLEALLNEMGKMAKVGAWELDLETLEQLWTEEVFHIHELGFDHKPTLESGLNFYDPADRHIIESAAKKTMTTGEPFDLELRFITAKGKNRWVHSIGMAERKDGKIVKIRGTFQDITERKKAELESLLAKKQIEFILGATKTNLDIIDSDFNVLYVDPAWEKLYGDYKGKKCYFYFRGTNKMCPSCAIPEALRTKKTVVKEEIMPQEGGRTVLVTTVPFQDENGSWLVAEVNADISTLKKTQEELSRKVREFETFYKVSMNREGRILELKEEIKRLKNTSK